MSTGTTHYRPQAKTLRLLDQVQAVLDSWDGDMTLRQVFYQLVAHHEYANTEREYRRLSQQLTTARVHRLVDPARIVDRTREVDPPYGFADLAEYLRASSEYRYQRPRWQGQPEYVEVWVEKDALAGVFEPIAREYGVPLQVCRGYLSFSALRDAAARFGEAATERRAPIDCCHLLYFGDFDPSGQDIPRVVGDNLREWFGCDVEPERIALTRQQIDEHRLPPVPAKRTDTRSAAFVRRHGDCTVELDALHPRVLQALIREAVERYADLTQFEVVQAKEDDERARLRELVAWSGCGRSDGAASRGDGG